jgi:hypothetical protein
VVNGKKVHNFKTAGLLDFIQCVILHFKDGLSQEIFSMIGSLAIIGSPLNFFSKMRGGLKDFVVLPAEGF